ncbi:hypothetical protein [Paenibacillus monticola]|nr:hypothetical protein [Paenibacillus monticola]
MKGDYPDVLSYASQMAGAEGSRAAQLPLCAAALPASSSFGRGGCNAAA